MNNIPIVLSIAGTDPSGGAGISADIKTISATGSYAAAVITALVSQNTQGVQAIFDISPEFVSTQLKSIRTDLHVSAIKIGMLHRADIIEVISTTLNEIKPIPVVFDPVMVAKDGSVLLDLNTIEYLKTALIPQVSLITPNLFEANYLLQRQITSFDAMEYAAQELGNTYQINVLIKGGHLEQSQSKDVLYLFKEKTCHWYEATRIMTRHTHGTGCTLSAAIASYLAQNLTLVEAVARAKKYLILAIESGSTMQIGKGNGPVDHFYFLNNRGNSY